MRNERSKSERDTSIRRPKDVSNVLLYEVHNLSFVCRVSSNWDVEQSCCVVKRPASYLSAASIVNFGGTFVNFFFDKAKEIGDFFETSAVFRMGMLVE